MNNPHNSDSFNLNDLSPEQQKMLIEIRRRKTELLLEIQVPTRALSPKCDGDLPNPLALCKQYQLSVVPEIRCCMVTDNLVSALVISLIACAISPLSKPEEGMEVLEILGYNFGV
ncbi:hypothetical protein LSTR_LSTR009998 [Laodelphax striatellus]|uniref:Uncharacterized protein n=1 Tax=Laodelphax striatellus TaxID=195883 RepID=A0A482WWN9_LAOST|nr:hypothetical protein LSTR_LSTR009998 [Laodelphax striatellus]